MVELLDWQQAGLKEKSIVKPVLASVEKAFIGDMFGELTSRDKRAVKLAIADVLGFRQAPAQARRP